MEKKIIKKNKNNHIGDTATLTSPFTRQEGEKSLNQESGYFLKVQGLHGCPGWSYFDFNRETDSQLAHPFHVAPDELSHLNYVITDHLRKTGREEDND